MKLRIRITLFVAFTAMLAMAAAAGSQLLTDRLHLPRFVSWAVAAAVVLPIVLWSAHAISSRVEELHAVLGNALSAFRDGDFSLRLAVRGDRELAELKRLYNELADTVRDDRHELHQREVLLDTVLQRTPIAVVLLNTAARVVYSNHAARELLAGGARLNGRLLDELSLQDVLRAAIDAAGDTLFAADDDTYHLTQRLLHVNGQRHRLLLIERLTPELRRQEVGVWKKAIRVINHEINNTVAPVSSLFHSAKRAQAKPEHRHRLEEIYGLIEERLSYLRSFLDAYASFARLPQPQKTGTQWSEILDAVQALYPFRVEGQPSLECEIDRSQMQQVLINLVKNAHESGSSAEEVRVSVERSGGDCVLRVFDRGGGMSEETMRQAFVPFYSTKQGGSGVGLALCNEIVEGHGGQMRIESREGGGTVVSCWIPIAS